MHILYNLIQKKLGSIRIKTNVGNIFQCSVLPKRNNQGDVVCSPYMILSNLGLVNEHRKIQDISVRKPRLVELVKHS